MLYIMRKVAKHWILIDKMTGSGNTSPGMLRRRQNFRVCLLKLGNIDLVSGIKSVRVVIFSLNFPFKRTYWSWNYLRLGTEKCMLLRLWLRRESKQARSCHKDDLLCQVTKLNFHVFRRFVGPCLYAKSITVTRDCDNFDGCIEKRPPLFPQPVLFPGLIISANYPQKTKEYYLTKGISTTKPQNKKKVWQTPFCAFWISF